MRHELREAVSLFVHFRLFDEYIAAIKAFARTAVQASREETEVKAVSDRARGDVNQQGGVKEEVPTGIAARKVGHSEFTLYECVN